MLTGADSLFNLSTSLNHLDHPEVRSQTMNGQPTSHEQDSSDAQSNSPDLVQTTADTGNVQQVVLTPARMQIANAISFDNLFPYLLDEHMNPVQPPRYQTFGFENLHESALANSNFFSSPSGLLQPNSPPALVTHPHSAYHTKQSCCSGGVVNGRPTSGSAVIDLEISWSLFEEL